MYIAWSWEIRRFVPVMNFSFKGGILTRPAECISFWAAALITTHLKMIQLLWTLILLWNFNVILLRQIFINIDGKVHVQLFNYLLILVIWIFLNHTNLGDKKYSYKSLDTIFWSIQHKIVNMSSEAGVSLTINDNILKSRKSVYTEKLWELITIILL